MLIGTSQKGNIQKTNKYINLVISEKVKPNLETTNTIRMANIKSTVNVMLLKDMERYSLHSLQA
jgi:hypothetical protein